MQHFFERPFFTRLSAYPLFVLMGVGMLLIFLATPARAATTDVQDTQFIIDSLYDDSARDTVQATHVLDGNHAHFYVEDSFSSSLNSVGHDQLSSYVQNLSNDFDTTIYPNETFVFGNEWKPGIDNDVKITVLITPMRNSAGGYFRPQDEGLAADSNQREMVYVNAHLIQHPHIHEFLAHEFQHLINYNQKVRLQGFQDEVWLNEMMSEVAPMVSGLYQEPTFSYDRSNIHDRVTTFLAAPNDDVLDWNETVQDYGSVALLGYYLEEHYGPQLFTYLEQSNTTGVAALNEALQKIGVQKTFKQIFSDWVTATIVNNCNIAPSNLYCYTDPFLNYDNLHIQFNQTKIGSSQIAFNQETAEWAGNWFRYSPPSSSTQTNMTYLNFSFSAPPTSAEFLGSYIVYNTDGSAQVYPLAFPGGAAKWSVPSFGINVKQVDVTFADFFHTQATNNNPFKSTYNLDASLDSAPSFHEGDFIRAIGGIKVYAIKGSYKRWIQSAAIFNSYGNLSWSNIQDVSLQTAALYQDSSLVELLGDPRVFIEYADGTKHWITTEQVFLNHGYTWNMIFIINEKEFNLFPRGDNIT